MSCVKSNTTDTDLCAAAFWWDHLFQAPWTTQSNNADCLVNTAGSSGQNPILDSNASYKLVSRLKWLHKIVKALWRPSDSKVNSIFSVLCTGGVGLPTLQLHSSSAREKIRPQRSLGFRAYSPKQQNIPFWTSTVFEQWGQVYLNTAPTKGNVSALTLWWTSWGGEGLWGSYTLRNLPKRSNSGEDQQRWFLIPYTHGCMCAHSTPCPFMG